MRRFLGVFFALVYMPLAAEIISVDLTWNEKYCDARCSEFVERTYKKVPEISSISMGPGYMTLNWKPNAPFTYLKVRRPMQRVGLHIQGIAVTVRGTVRREGEKVFLTSIGDGSVFELTSPPPADTTGGYTSYSNRKLYKLIPDVLVTLSNAERNAGVVKVTGYLLMPYCLKPTIIIGNLSVQKAE